MIKKGQIGESCILNLFEPLNLFLHFLHFPNTSTSQFCKNRPERKWHLGAPFVILEFRNVFSFMAPQIHGQISPLFGTWVTDMNQGIPEKDRNQYIAEQISCDIIIQIRFVFLARNQRTHSVRGYRKTSTFEKTEKRNYNTRSKTFNVIFCVVRNNNDVHFISLSSFSSIRTIFGPDRLKKTLSGWKMMTSISFMFNLLNRN